MGKGVLWNGKYYLIPQASSRIDSSALTNSPLGGANKVVMMGNMTGLVVPGKAIKIGSPSLINQLIHPNCEEARLAGNLLFDPSTTAQGASEVYLVPTNAALAASANVTSVDAGTAFKLDTYLYGTCANQVKYKIENGTKYAAAELATPGQIIVRPSKKVSIQYLDNVETFDDIHKDSFSVQYTGTGSAATININMAAGTITTTVTGATADNVSFSFTNLPNIQSVVDAFNATAKYSATAITKRPKDDSCLDMDYISGNRECKVSAVIATSNGKAIVDAINKSSGYVSATLQYMSMPVNQTSWTYLTGGSDGTEDTTTWLNALLLLQTMKIDLILPLTDNTSYHYMVDSHCRWMSGPNGKSERRCFIGGELQNWNGEANRLIAIGNMLTYSRDLNSDRTVHVGLGSKHYSPAGVKTLYPAYITAAMYCGLAGGSSPVEPLTRKFLRCLGLEVELRISEIETMLETNACAVPIPDPVRGAGYVISRQLTCWNQDDDLYRIEFSVGRGADYIAREVRNRHELLIGKAGTEQLDITIVNITNAVLQAAKREGYIRNYDPKLTQLLVDGTIRYVDYFAEPILPVNWIFSTYHLMPTKFSIGL
jgi:hypothetical protein